MVVDLNPGGGTETVELIGREGGTATFVEMGVTPASSVAALVDGAVKQHRRRAVLQNNTGSAAIAYAKDSIRVNCVWEVLTDTPEVGGTNGRFYIWPLSDVRLRRDASLSSFVDPTVEA